MDYTQERVATLHDYGAANPDAPTERATVVVPMTEREYGGLATESVLSTLETLDVARVVVPLRASAEKAGAFAEWLDSFDLPLDVLWCNGPRIADALATHGLDGPAGKGRDVWLALGQAADAPFVAVHDADTKTYTERDVPKLLHPLDQGFSFVKGYYARVENDRLYGRLFRLCYEPLVDALDARADAPILDYLGAFRYALAGECAMTGAVARSLRVPRTWGLEVGTLGDAFDAAGFDGTAQVDLGRYEHDHRAVSGPSGLSDMSAGVVGALLRACADHGVAVDYDTLPGRYRETAHRYVRQYAADAAFNDLDYDAADEREQIDAYADAVSPPENDDRLPAWADTDLDAETVREAALGELAFKRGEDVDGDAYADAIDRALDAYALVRIRRADADLLVSGPTAFPSIPEGGMDLPHILDVDRRDVPREDRAAAFRARFDEDLAADPDADRLDFLVDVTYDAETWAAVDADALRDRVADRREG